MGFHKVGNHCNNNYSKAVEVINFGIPASFPVSEELWIELEKLLLDGNSTSIVGQQIRRLTRLVDYSESQLPEFFWDFLSVFAVHYHSDRSVLDAKLEAIYLHNPEPGQEFLSWLLQEFLKTVIKDYKNQIYRETRIEATQDELYWESQSVKDGNEIELTPDSYEKDKAERSKNKIEYCRCHVVQLALATIVQKMSKKNWKNETQFKQPGIQMYPFLYDKSIPMEDSEIELLRQMGENTEDYVSQLHGVCSNFQPANYLAEVHDQASRQFALARQKWENGYHKTRHFSNRRIEGTRKGIKMIADSWLAPLDNTLVSEVCKVDIRYADQLLSRYKKDFLSEIYRNVNNYQEDKDV